MKPGPFAAAWIVIATSLALGAEPQSTTADDASATSLEVIGLAAGNRLLRFSLATPGAVSVVAVQGANGDLLGIDRRPMDGRLYGITSRNDLYAIDVASGEARWISSLTHGFEGSERSGFDFNPQADRLRLLAASGQNLRVHVALGAVATDGPLAYAAGDPNAGNQPNMMAVAYTDNVPEAPVTRTFDIDWRLDVLALQEPPNAGELQTIGPLGADFGPLGGFDIHTEANGVERAYAVSGTTLYAIDLATGAAKTLGRVGDGSVPLIGLALVPASAP